MNAKTIHVPVHEIRITEEERFALMRQVKSVNDGEGAIDDYEELKTFISMLRNLDDEAATVKL